ncbi:circadian clock-controlled protein daywake-like [Chironomus tepperi]|uniref:circadian clock-controlled protein daywake-like n=1 Tax=Chironomus tepperi TaxID=113505 RepID=UPI00391EFC7D
MSECVVQAINAIAPGFATGDLGGGFRVPTLEPFHIKQLILGKDGNLKVHLTDVNVYGSSNFKIDKLRVNVDDLRFDILLTLTKFDVYAKYKMNLNFFGSVVASDGLLHTLHTNSKAKVTMKANKYLKNGKEFIKFEPFSIKIKRGGFKIVEITNLFGGNKVLGEIVTTLLENSPENLSSNIYPQLEAELSSVFTSISNSIVEHASYDELFP